MAYRHISADDRARALQVSVEKSVESVHRGGVTWLDLDGIEHRWLLSVAADASIAAYDVQARGRRAIIM